MKKFATFLLIITFGFALWRWVPAQGHPHYENNGRIGVDPETDLPIACGLNGDQCYWQKPSKADPGT